MKLLKIISLFILALAGLVLISGFIKFNFLNDDIYVTDSSGDLVREIDQKGIENFDECLVAGGDVMESYPQQCAINGQHFTEVLGPENKGESLARTFKVASQKTNCTGSFPQECLVVNGGLFYDQIDGFSYEPGYEYVLKVTQTQWCDPTVINDCPQDAGIYRYKLDKIVSKTAVNLLDDSTQAGCQKNGGVWEKVGKLQAPTCIYYYTDAGETCSSSSDCEGDCIVTETDGSNPSCAKNNNVFGCKSTIEDFAETGGILCID